jgi:hypothetical protein
VVLDFPRRGCYSKRGSVKRIDIKAILRDPAKRRELMVLTIIATQAREGITTSRAQAEAAYDKVQGEQRAKNLRFGK